MDVVVTPTREQRHRQAIRGLEAMITTIETETEAAVITEEEMIAGIIMIRGTTNIMAIGTVTTEIQTEDALMIMEVLQKDNGGDRKREWDNTKYE
mmetsp:Transcript_36350/g.74095  ORF Transcript_36350/g.74095 Transcript_36350/m.74095 type:complete len:95 (-) Transcript_36350:2518-2802(-)